MSDRPPISDTLPGPLDGFRIVDMTTMLSGPMGTCLLGDQGADVIKVESPGVGDLVRLGAERGRSTKPGLKLGVCGEHGGDPASIQLFHDAGLDYVSCSPFRVPVARLAAAQAIIGNSDAHSQK